LLEQATQDDRLGFQRCAALLDRRVQDWRYGHVAAVRMPTADFGLPLGGGRAHEERPVVKSMAARPNVRLPSEGGPEVVRMLREGRKLPSRVRFHEKTNCLTASTRASLSFPDLQKGDLYEPVCRGRDVGVCISGMRSRLALGASDLRSANVEKRGPLPYFIPYDPVPPSVIKTFSELEMGFCYS
jgi:hypothetical protein